MGILGFFGEYKREYESDIKFSAVFENSTEAIILLDNDTILDCNPAAEKIFGLTRNNLVGKTPADVSPEYQPCGRSSSELASKLISSAISGNPQKFEWVHKNNGKNIIADISLVPVIIKNKKITAAFLHDITIYKNTLKSLKKSEELYRKLAENFPNGTVSVYDKDLNLLFVSGKDRDPQKTLADIIGKNFRDLVPAEYFLKVEPYFQKAYNGQTVNFDFIYTDKYYIVTITPLKNDDGSISEIMVVAQNATESYFAKKKQGELQNKLSEVLEHSVSLFYSHDSNGILTYVSPQSKKYMGCEPEEAMIHWSEFITDNPINLLGVESTNKAIETGIPQPPYELELKKKNGEIIWVEVRETPVVKEGKTVSIVGSLTDITEKHNAQIALFESEEKYRNLVENINDIVYKVDEKGIITFISSAAERLMGFKTEEIIGRYFIEFIHPEEHERVFNNFMKLPYINHLQDEFRIINKLGEYKDMQITGTGVFKDSLYKGASGVLVDITEKKKILAQVKFQSHLLNEIGEAIMATDLEGKITYWNKGAEKMYGWSLEEVFGKNIFNVTPTTELDDYAQKLFDKIKKGEVWAGEFKVRRKDGSLFIAEVTDSPVYDNNGKIIGVIGISTDITDRKNAEEALKKSQMLLTNAVEIASMGHWEYDVENDVFTFNKQFYRMMKTSVEEVGSYTLSSSNYAKRFVHPDEISVVETEIKKALESSDPDYYRELEHRIIYPDGKSGSIIVRFNIIKDSSGKTVKLYGVNQDITDRKKIIEELIKAKEQAEEANRLKSNFLANMSHELRTPMVGILGYSEILENELTSAEHSEMVSIIKTSGNRLIDTLNSILELSKIESNKQELHLEIVNVKELIKETANLFKPIALNKSIEIKSFLPDQPVYINSDKDILIKIFNNLINNAIKFTPSGSVTIFLSEIHNGIGDYIKVNITDTGIGINEKYHKIIFEPFRQVSEGFSRKFEGNGLGLSITKKFVEMLNGKIQIESIPDKGSTFSIMLPI